MTKIHIDRLSSTPYYQQLSNYLEQQIKVGNIPAGTRLPSENEMCNESGLSRATVRQALQTLESRGYATRVNGRGVYATQKESSHGWVIQGGEGFLENAMGHQNRAVKTSVLHHERCALPQIACTALNLAPGSRGYRLERLRFLDDSPALYSINYSPPFVVPIIESADQVLRGMASFSELLSSEGVHLGGANRTIWSVPADEVIAKHLNIAAGTPLLHIRSVSWTTEGVRFDIYDTWVRSDVIPLEINVSTVQLGGR